MTNLAVENMAKQGSTRPNALTFISMNALNLIKHRSLSIPSVWCAVDRPLKSL